MPSSYRNAYTACPASNSTTPSIIPWNHKPGVCVTLSANDLLRGAEPLKTTHPPKVWSNPLHYANQTEASGKSLSLLPHPPPRRSLGATRAAPNPSPPPASPLLPPDLAATGDSCRQARAAPRKVAARLAAPASRGGHGVPGWRPRSRWAALFPAADGGCGCSAGLLGLLGRRGPGGWSSRWPDFLRRSASRSESASSKSTLLTFSRSISAPVRPCSPDPVVAGVLAVGLLGPGETLGRRRRPQPRRCRGVELLLGGFVEDDGAATALFPFLKAPSLYCGVDVEFGCIGGCSGGIALHQPLAVSI
ncbi:uncharacterized protein [Triticum aestivum]|uniref:uncharacterized protein n=1 Tax=Triticum aestivum TaxID=4565 RepID=UPI001D029B94|nr:uncharacterized protein LOC123039618 [Triticum aestivum]